MKYDVLWSSHFGERSLKSVDDDKLELQRETHFLYYAVVDAILGLVPSVDAIELKDFMRASACDIKIAPFPRGV